MDKLEWMIPPEKHLTIRTSALKMFLKCPAQAMFRYFKGIVVPPKSYTTVGSCTHVTAEHQNLFKLRRGRDAKLSTLQDVFNEEWKVRKKKTKFASYERPDKIKTNAIYNVIPVYYQSLAKKVKPKYVEKSFSLEFPSVNATLTGQIDLVVVGNTIRDLKTKSKVPDWMDVFKSVQEVSYWLGYEANFGKAPKEFILDYLLRNSNPRHETSRPKTVTPKEVEEFVTLFERVVKQIRMGMFYPKREMNYLCSPKMCGYWNMCTKGQWLKTPKDGCIFMGNDGGET